MGIQHTKLRVSAMPAVSEVEEETIMALRWNIKNLLPESHKGNDLHKDIYYEALNTTGLPESDIQILSALFDMHDSNSDGIADYRDVLCGLVLLITGTAEEKLLCAFKVYDEEITARKGSLMSGEVRKIVNAIHRTAQFFGDAGISETHAKEAIIDIFKKAPSPAAPLKYADIVDDVINHSRIQMFLRGQGSEDFSYIGR
jgi:Ca2+-binding EF-hand superfamily protein